ncbi:hypothetical protein CYMTET_55197 [Cymbomonas tetramitiformis]|uniref:Uncharacterized protein n=1 Tax=Cymbomonas tetramitiformis TaxID=36881 RepID=A0AAE0BDX6_9CHLO|nr:hypothetical protein CYMTET_55197 [Cymbomonas tetramitiformis]|eukprot:gene95-142_t
MKIHQKQAVVDRITSRAAEILQAHEPHRTSTERTQNLYPIFVVSQEIGDISSDLPWGRAEALDTTNVYKTMSENIKRAQCYFEIDRVIRDASTKTNPIRYNPYIRYSSNMKDLRLLQRLTVDRVDSGLSWDFLDESDTTCCFTPVQLALAYILWKSGFEYQYVTEMTNVHIWKDAFPELDATSMDRLPSIKISNRADKGMQIKMLSLPPGQGKTNIAINALLAVLQPPTLDRLFARHTQTSRACDKHSISLIDVSVDTIFSHVVVVVVPNNVYGHWHRRLQNECARKGTLCYPNKVTSRFTNNEVRKIFETCSRPKGVANVSGVSLQTAVILLNPKQFALLEKCEWIRNQNNEYAWPLTVMDEISSHVDDMCRKVIPNCLQLWGITATPTDTFLGRNTGYMYRFMRPAMSMERSPNSLVLQYYKRKRRGQTQSYDPKQRFLEDFKKTAYGNTYWMCLSVVTPYMETWLLEDHAMYMPLGISSIKYISPESASSSLTHKVFSNGITDSSTWYTGIFNHYPEGFANRYEIDLLKFGVTRSNRELEGGEAINRSYGISCTDRTKYMAGTITKEHVDRVSYNVVEPTQRIPGILGQRTRIAWDFYIFNWIAVDNPCTLMGVSSFLSNLDIAIDNSIVYVNDLRNIPGHRDSKLLNALGEYLSHLESLRTRVQNTVPIWMHSEVVSSSKDGSGSSDMLLICLVCGGQFLLGDMLRFTWFSDYCDWTLISDDMGGDQECLVVSIQAVRCPCCSWKLSVDESIKPLVEMTATTHLHKANLLSREARDEWSEEEGEAVASKLRSDMLRAHVQSSQSLSSRAEFKMEKLFMDGLQSCYDHHTKTSLDGCGAFFALDCYLYNAIFRFDCTRILIFYRGENCLEQFSDVLRVLNTYIPHDKRRPSTSTYTGVSSVSARSLTEGMKKGKSYRAVKDVNSSWFLEGTSDVRVMYLLAKDGGSEETHGLNLNNTDLIIFYGPGANLVQSISRGLRMSVKRRNKQKVLNVLHMS